ncbi:MAG TPA: cytochrome c biogenesis protein CcsA [Thermoanaerobaculia bacterium]
MKETNLSAAPGKGNLASKAGAILLGVGAYFGIIGALHFYVPAVQPWMHLNLGGGGQALVGATCALAGTLLLLLADDLRSRPGAATALLAVGAVALIIGSAIGLFAAPAEQFMGETQRIMYVHVPTAWSALLAITFGFGCAIAFLFNGDFRYDSRLEASIEVGVLFAFLLCVQGAIWAKPTWGVWWDWDPRLTTTAVLLFAFLGILALRNFVDDPVKRGIWSSVATIIAFVDVPIIYFSVRWWNSLHQVQSTPDTVASPFHLPLRISAFGILFLMIGFIMLRARIADQRLQQELTAPPEMMGEEAGELA